MESAEYSALPIILVSAKDQDSARAVISTIIDNEPEMFINDKPENNYKHAWRLVNKYYTADVRFHVLPDDEELSSQLENRIEGHLIYLTESEASSSALQTAYSGCRDSLREAFMRKGTPAAAVELMIASISDNTVKQYNALDKTAVDVMECRRRSGKDAKVRVIVVDCELEDGALVSSAALHHYELIPLRAPADPEIGEPAGLERVRAAFHAHVWANIQTNTPHLHLAAQENGEDSDSDSWSSWQGADERREGETEEQFMRRAEAFAVALGSLPEAVAEVRGANGNRSMRIARAELVISAFCDALGEPFDWPLEFDREL